MQVPYLPATTGSSLSTDEATAARSALRTLRATGPPSTRPTLSRSWTPPAPSALWSCHFTRCRLLTAPGRCPPGTRDSPGFHQPNHPAGAVLPGADAHARASRNARMTSGWAKITPGTGSVTTPGFWNSSPPRFHRAALDQARGRHRMGDRNNTGDPDRNAAGSDPRSGRDIRAARRRPVPVPGIQGTDDAIVGPDAGRTGRGPGKPARLVELAGSGHAPTPATRSRSTCSSASSLTGSRPRAGRPSAGTAAAAAPSAPCIFPPRSGWDTPAGTRPSPMSCAGCIQAWRSTGWLSIR